MGTAAESRLEVGEGVKGREWYEKKFLPRIGPVALVVLLYTIVILFALQGHTITSGEALAGVVGPLIEVPVLVSLVYVALWARGRLFAATDPDPGIRGQSGSGG